MNPKTARRVEVHADSLLAGSSLRAESLLHAARQRPWVVLRAPFWMWGGMAWFDRELVARFPDVDVATLPYQEERLTELREEAAQGAQLVLVTSGSEALARRMANHLGIFSAVESGPALRRTGEGASAAAVLQALRPYQWLKNTLVLLPFLLAHELHSMEKWVAAALMFAAFSFCASASYAMNDIFDRQQDRRHPRRSRRPIASGAVPLWTALWLPAPLVAGAAICCAFLPLACGLALTAYLVLTAVYSTVAKRLVMADVILLAILYLLRLLAGSLATGNVVSHWLLAFALALFLSLALSKRVSELIAWQSMACDHAPGRSYRAEDVPVLQAMAVASGFLACLIMVLYIQSPEILRLYRRPEFLWVMVVALLYWLGRLFLYSHRGECPDDPLFFAIQDRTTFCVLVAAAALVVMAV